jgi:hypothetical protein
MKLVNFSYKRRYQVFTEQIIRSSRPVLLYIGGLHEIHDDTDRGVFFDYMDQLFGHLDVQTVMPIDTETNSEELIKIRGEFNDGIAPPSHLAEFIYNNTFAKIIENCPDIYDPTSLKQLQHSLTNISVFGYSYGTSLLQQVGVLMADHLSSISSSDEFRGTRIFEICRSVKAATIAPVSRLYQIHLNGTTSPLRYDDPDFGNAGTLFTQANFLIREDRLVHRSYGDECLNGKLISDTGIEVRATRSAKLIIDYTEHPTRAALGFTQAALGEIVPHIIESFDPFIHHPRLYTNTYEKLGNLQVFPSIAIGSVFRNALVSMLQPDRNAEAWLSNIGGQVESPDKRNSLMAAFCAMRHEFESILKTARSLPDQEAGQLLKNFVEVSH